MIINRYKIPYLTFLFFSVIVLTLYFLIYSIDFQFLKKLLHLESISYLYEENISRYINLYIKTILFICLTGIVSSILIFIASPEKLLCKIFRKYFLFILMFFFFSYILTLQILKFKSFHCYIDLAVPLQVLYNFIIGNGPISTVQECTDNITKNWFGIHFSPILYPVSTIFYLFPRPETIIILQTLGYTLTCIPLYCYAKELLKSEVAGVLFAISFLLYPPIHYAALYEFEYLKFSIPFLMFTFYFLYKKKYKLYFLFLLLSLSSREEISLVVFTLGIYIILVRKEIKIGVITSTISIIYFIIIILYIIPSFRGGEGHAHLGRYQYLGKNASEILHTIIFEPILVIKVLFSPLRIINFILYALPLFFISFFSPSVFFISAPNMLTSFLSSSIPNYTIFLYQLSPSIPFIFLSSVNGINNITSYLNKRLSTSFKNKKTVPLFMINLAKKDSVVLCSFTLLIVSILSHFFWSPSPLSRQFWDKNYKLADFYTHNFHFSNYKLNEHDVVVNEMIESIPDDVIISAEQPLLPHLYKRKKLYVFPIIKNDTEYVLIDKKHRVKTSVNIGMDFRSRSQFYYEQIENNSKDWKLIKEKDGIYLFKNCTTIYNE